MNQEKIMTRQKGKTSISKKTQSDSQFMKINYEDEDNEKNEIIRSLKEENRHLWKIIEEKEILILEKEKYAIQLKNENERLQINYDFITTNLEEKETIMNSLNTISKKIEEAEKMYVSQKIPDKQLTYATILKKEASYKKPSLIIKAKDKSRDTVGTVKKTLSDIKNIKVEKVINLRESETIVKFKSEIDRKKAKKIMEQAMKEKYQIKEQDFKLPKIKIVGIEDVNLDKEKIKQEIIERNLDENIESTNSVNVVHTYVNKKNNTLSAICEVDSTTYTKIMYNKKVYIGWQRCLVFDVYDLNRCYNCCGYNHSKSKCNNTKACKNCSGEHDVKDCNEEIKICTNCKYVKNKYKVNIDIYHSADDNFKCNTYKNKFKKLIEITDYPYIPESARKMLSTDLNTIVLAAN